MAQETHIFGVRHHGPGSARAVLRALDSVQPDCILIEGPPDADEMISSAAHEGMQPPVAILIYQVDDPKQAVFYPFAEFSPEWCTIRWAVAKSVPVRFMDLPQAHRLALDAEQEKEQAEAPDAETSTKGEEAEAANQTTITAEQFMRRLDPLGGLAQAAGFDDGERWWEHTFEHRQQPDTEVFTAIREAMSALREEPTESQAPLPWNRDEPLREAWMRRTIREAKKESQKIAVICGAWHAPVLSDEAIDKFKKDDTARLKSLPKVKVAATWIPWTYDRLAMASGYGAGIQSPGWYEHLWRNDTHVLERWMTRVARFLREEDIDCSSAHAIEATRLASALAVMRKRPLADLSDIADSCRAVFCFDSDLGMRLIARKLLIGERLGEVPDDTPLVPLQQDLQREQKRLRMKPEALEKVLDLDLRNETDLGRSYLLHRLRILGIDWGTLEPARSGKGTFHELWRLRWDPACLVRLVELGAWGNTVADAASAYTSNQAGETDDLQILTQLLSAVLLANLPAAVEKLMAKIIAAAAVGADVAKLMDALPPLAQSLRYGNVRQTDKEMVRRAIDGILPRIFIGLGGAVASLNDEAAKEMEGRIVRVHDATQLLESPDEVREWQTCLARIADQQSVHGLIRGRSTRMLFDAGQFTADDVATRLSLMLSRGGDAAQGAAWIEGFLSGSGLLLLHHSELLTILDQWVCSIATDVFIQQVPLLRRTFSTFPPAERRQIGERLIAGFDSVAAPAASDNSIDHARAARVLPILRTIFAASAPKEEKR